MTEYRAWIIRAKEQRWVPIGTHADQAAAERFAQKKYRARLVSVREIPKPNKAAA